MENLFFASTDNLIRILVSAPVLYVAVIAFIRISGKRSTSQLNNFDWVVTVAMGSLMGSGIIVRDITLAEVLLAMIVLLGLQYLVTKGLMKSDLVEQVVKARPTLLFHNGEFLRGAMREERITETEVLSAIRGSGIGRMEDVAAVILETDARLSVIEGGGRGDTELTALRDLESTR